MTPVASINRADVESALAHLKRAAGRKRNVGDGILRTTAGGIEVVWGAAAVDVEARGVVAGVTVTLDNPLMLRLLDVLPAADPVIVGVDETHLHLSGLRLPARIRRDVGSDRSALDRLATSPAKDAFDEATSQRLEQAAIAAAVHLAPFGIPAVDVVAFAFDVARRRRAARDP